MFLDSVDRRTHRIPLRYGQVIITTARSLASPTLQILRHNLLFPWDPGDRESKAMTDLSGAGEPMKSPVAVRIHWTRARYPSFALSIIACLGMAREWFMVTDASEADHSDGYVSNNIGQPDKE